MYETIKRLYLAGKLSDVSLDNAVTKGWITFEEEEEIKALKIN